MQVSIGIRSTQVLQPSRLHGADQCHEHYPRRHEKYVMFYYIVKDARLIKYFGSFPFLSYVLTYCCQVKDRITSLNNHLRQVSEGKVDLTDDKELSRHSSIIKSYYIDLIDYISYLNDLIELGPE